MKKIFQNKSFLKSVQVFLVCLVVLGGVGNVENAEAVVGDTWIEVTPSANWAPKWTRGFAVVFNNEMWIVGDYTGGNPANSWRSSDGVSWTEVVSGSTWGGKSYYHNALVFDHDSDGTEEIVVIGGVVAAVGFSKDVFASNDGVSWVQLTANGFSRRQFDSVVFNNKMWVVGGNLTPSGAAIFTDAVLDSSDGITWNNLGGAGWSPRALLSLTVFDNKMWVMGGIVNTIPCIYQNDVWYSNDGITWTEITSVGATWGERAGHSSVVFDNKLWIMGGYDCSGNYLNDIWYLDLTDINYGANTGVWHQVVVVSPLVWWQERFLHDSLVFNNEIWIIGGHKGFPSPFLDDVWRTDTIWPPTCTLTASPNAIIAGGSSTLTWTTTNTATVAVDNGVVSTAFSDSESVTPAATTTYTLTATNASGDTATCSANVTVTAFVPPPPPPPPPPLCDPRLGLFCNPLKSKTNSIAEGITLVALYLLSLVGIITLAFMVIAGIRYIISAGNPEKMKSAKDALFSAGSGLAIIVLSYTILSIIHGILSA